jgi:hypothetical protein
MVSILLFDMNLTIDDGKSQIWAEFFPFFPQSDWSSPTLILLPPYALPNSASSASNRSSIPHMHGGVYLLAG